MRFVSFNLKDSKENLLTLEPGDVIPIGTPAEMGAAREPTLFFHAGIAGVKTCVV